MSSATFAELKEESVPGSWKYEFSSAPEGYNKGTLIFTKQDNGLKGEVKFADGTKVLSKK